MRYLDVNVPIHVKITIGDLTSYKFAYKDIMDMDHMTTWSKDATEFTVSVTRNVKCHTIYSYIPKPILDMLGTPRHLTFAVENGKVTVKAGQK